MRARTLLSFGGPKNSPMAPRGRMTGRMNSLAAPCHAAPCFSGRAHPCVAARGVYDNPGLYSSTDQFSEASYWNARYDQDQKVFEWYRGYRSLAPILELHLPMDRPVLQVGVGTSDIQIDMLEAGYTRVVSIDYSKRAIEIMQERHKGVEGLEYTVADARNMRALYTDGCFASILDKGTLDALLCGDNDEADARAMLGECLRVLAPGGSYLMVTHSSPKARLQYLDKLPWDISVYEVGQQGYMEGPYPLTGLATPEEASAVVASLPKELYSHFVYLCRKRLDSSE